MPENKALVIWNKEDVAAHVAKAHSLASKSGGLTKYAGQELMEHTVLIGEAAKQLLIKAGEAETVEDAVKLFLAGSKLHAEWREVMLPIAKRVWIDEEAKKKSGRKTKQVPRAGGLSTWTGTVRRGGEGDPGTDPDFSEAGFAGVVEVGPVVIPDRDRPGHGGTNHQDGGSEGQEEPGQGIS